MAESPHHSHWSTLLVTSGLSHWARLVGAILALRFRNKETELMCPKVPTIAAVAGCSESTVKRAIKELETDGWIERTDGRGAGQFTKYRLRWPGKVTPMRKAASDDEDLSEKLTDDRLDQPANRRKSSRKSHQEAMGDPFYNNQNLNQKTGARESGCDRHSLCPVTALRVIGDHETDRLTEWDRQLAVWQLPPIRVLAQRGADSGDEGLLWPLRWVPSDPAQLARVKNYARWLFEAKAKHAPYNQLIENTNSPHPARSRRISR